MLRFVGVFLVAVSIIVFSVASADAQAASAAKATSPLRLRVVDMTRFFVTPNQPAVLSWKIRSSEGPRTLRWNISNYWGHPVAAGTLTTVDNIINLPVRLPRGFYQVDFPANGQKFGIVSIAAYHGPMDHFFAIDGEMGSLVQQKGAQAERVGMIKVIHRAGIGMAREYFSWSQINPAPGKYNWDGSSAFDFYAGLKRFATIQGRFSRTGWLAEDYFRGGVRMMQMFRDAPPWTWDGSPGPYPINLAQVARSWAVIGHHFQRDWGALELWNEPDGANLPPDQLLPMVKTIAYSFQNAGIRVPLIGGVFANPRPGFFQYACARNGLLNQVNVITFHDYYAPTDILPAVASYRKWLDSFGKRSMPLWIGESGHPWPCRAGEARPGRAPDMMSASWITMKAVEARACGISRYFAFCLPYFYRFGSNYGMMGKDLTPLRSMAAYVNCVAELSGWSYVGNLKIADHAVLLAPVFMRGNQQTAVVYTGKPNPHAAINLALHGISIRGIDGRILHRNAKGSIPIPDGLVYLRGTSAVFAGQVKTDTAASRLYAISRQPPPIIQRHSPIILQFDGGVPHPHVGWTRGGYVLSYSSRTPIRVRVWNLARQAVSVKLTLRGHQKHNSGKPGFALSVQRQIPAESSKMVQWTVNHLARDIGLGIAHSRYLVVTGHEISGKANAPAISPLAIPIRREGSLSRFLARYPRHTQLAIGKLSLWRKNATPNASMSFFTSNTGTWGMKVAFHGSDPWVWPQFRMPDGIDAKKVVGVLLRVRVTKPTALRLTMALKPGLPAEGTFLSPIITVDDKWKTVLVPLSRLTAIGSGTSPGNLAGVKFVSVGLNNGSATDGDNQLEVSNLYLVYRR